MNKTNTPEQQQHRSKPHGHCTHPRCREIWSAYLEVSERLAKYEPGATMHLNTAPEQAQAVEPCKGRNCGSISPKLHSAECFDEHDALTGCQRPFGYFHFVFDSDNGDYWRETDDESGTPLFTRPAPPAEAQQVAVPATGERAELVAKLRNIFKNEWVGDALREAADMLEADADLRTQLARRTVERDIAIGMAAGIEAQQVAVPAGYAIVPIEPTSEMLRAARVYDYTNPTDPTWGGIYSVMLKAAQGAKP